MYDVIIVGGGPAGLSAGIYAGRRQTKTLLVTKFIGGQTIWASKIENYPGFKEIPAQELTMKMADQAKASGVEIKLAEVKKIAKDENDNFIVSLEKENFSAKTVILALGADHRKLGVLGEEKLNGQGVAYCANCDGPLFRNKIVAVVGGGNSALDAAEVLSKIASKVYLIHQFEEFQAFEALVNAVKERENIEIILGNKVEEILGDNKVSGIKIKKVADNNVSEIDVDGVFVEIGFEVKTDLAEGLAILNGKQEIIVNEKGATSLDGLFGAGDATNIPYKQISIAVGAGTIAALGAYEYIQLKEGNLAKIIK